MALHWGHSREVIFIRRSLTPTELAARAGELWPIAEPVVMGIDFNDDSHRAVLTGDFPRFIGDYDYPGKEGDVAREYDFFTQNS